MKDLIIIGAGGFGRELFSAAREAVGFGEQFRVKTPIPPPSTVSPATRRSSARPRTSRPPPMTCSSPPLATSPPASAARN